MVTIFPLKSISIQTLSCRLSAQISFELRFVAFCLFAAILLFGVNKRRSNAHNTHIFGAPAYDSHVLFAEWNRFSVNQIRLNPRRMSKEKWTKKKKTESESDTEPDEEVKRSEDDKSNISDKWCVRMHVIWQSPHTWHRLSRYQYLFAYFFWSFVFLFVVVEFKIRWRGKMPDATIWENVSLPLIHSSMNYYNISVSRVTCHTQNARTTKMDASID